MLRDYDEVGGGYLSLTPTVGDIFLDARLRQRLELAASIPSIKGISVTTNAVLASRIPRQDLECILSRLHRIQVSIYGLDQDEYRKMTRRDNYAEMVASVRMILEICGNSDKVLFGFRLLKNRESEEIQRWIRETFGRDVKFGSTTKYGNWGGVLDTSKPLPHDAEWIPISLNRGQCAIPLLALQVSSSGDVSFCPCDDFKNVEELKLGNVRESKLADMYDSEKVAALYDFDAKFPAFCRSCTFHMPMPESAVIDAMCANPVAYIGG